MLRTYLRHTTNENKPRSIWLLLPVDNDKYTLQYNWEQAKEHFAITTRRQWHFSNTTEHVDASDTQSKDRL